MSLASTQVNLLLATGKSARLKHARALSISSLVMSELGMATAVRYEDDEVKPGWRLVRARFRDLP